MRYVIALLLLTLAPQTLAQALTTTDYSASIGTTATPCVPADASRKTLYIENESSTNNLGYCISTGNTACTPSIGTAGTSELSGSSNPSSAWWTNGSAPRDAVWCIASGASTPVTIRVGK